MSDEIDDIDPEEDDHEAEESGVAAGKPNYITPTGLQNLKVELNNLLNVERPKMVEVVAWAASNGDRSENADYYYGKRRLREIDRRIRILQKKLDAAVVVDPAVQRGEVVRFGATVAVEFESGEKKKFSIVGVDEADVKRQRVSWISPLAQALLQTKVGDTIVLKTPKSEEEILVVSVEYKTID